MATFDLDVLESGVSQFILKPVDIILAGKSVPVTNDNTDGSGINVGKIIICGVVLTVGRIVVSCV